MAREKHVSVTFFLAEGELEWLDAMAERLGRTRSDILRFCVENGREDWELMELLGITPERARGWMGLCDRMRTWFRRGVEEGEIPC
jgi:predicted DNA-binding protein